jgi:hypothetical protein
MDRSGSLSSEGSPNMLNGNGLPGWAKLVASTIAGCALLLGVFVTRAEFNSLSGRLDTMQATINQVLWRVGGPPLKRPDEGLTQSSLPELRTFLDTDGSPISICLDEPESVKPYLDALWEGVQAALHKKARKPRPVVCAMSEPFPVTFEDIGMTGTLYGYYNPKTNEILAAFNTPDISFRCIVTHEMIHALFGAGHWEPKWGERMAKVGCS